MCARNQSMCARTLMRSWSLSAPRDLFVTITFILPESHVTPYLTAPSRNLDMGGRHRA